MSKVQIWKKKIDKKRMVIYVKLFLLIYSNSVVYLLYFNIIEHIIYLRFFYKKKFAMFLSKIHYK